MGLPIVASAKMGGLSKRNARPSGCRQSPTSRTFHFGLQQCLHPWPRVSLNYTAYLLVNLSLISIMTSPFSRSFNAFGNANDKMVFNFSLEVLPQVIQIKLGGEPN